MYSGSGITQPAQMLLVAAGFVFRVFTVLQTGASSCWHCSITDAWLSYIQRLCVLLHQIVQACVPLAPRLHRYLVAQSLPCTCHLQVDPDLPLLTPDQRQSVTQLARCLGDQPHLIDWLQRQVSGAHALVTACSASMCCTYLWSAAQNLHPALLAWAAHPSYPS
jgi:hypothetical protein